MAQILSWSLDNQAQIYITWPPIVVSVKFDFNDPWIYRSAIPNQYFKPYHTCVHCGEWGPEFKAPDMDRASSAYIYKSCKACVSRWEESTFYRHMFRQGVWSLQSRPLVLHSADVLAALSVSYVYVLVIICKRRVFFYCSRCQVWQQCLEIQYDSKATPLAKVWIPKLKLSVKGK